MILLLLSGLALGGCAAPAPPPPPPALELPVYFYVGVSELNLKSFPDPASGNTGLVRLNERVEKLERRGSWFLVRTAAGQQGWVNERDLKLRPLTELYVRRWGVRLRAAPDDRSRIIERMRTNDQVQFLELDQRGWARVTLARTRETGWVELRDLSPDRVVVRRPVRRPAPAEAATEPPEPEEIPAAAPPAVIAPAPAQAAPPPPPKPAPPGVRQAEPEMFEPF